MIFELLKKLDPCKSMGPDNIHLRVLRELVDITMRINSIIFEKLWRSENRQKPMRTTDAYLFAGRT